MNSRPVTLQAVPEYGVSNPVTVRADRTGGNEGQPVNRCMALFASFTGMLLLRVTSRTPGDNVLHSMVRRLQMALDTLNFIQVLPLRVTLIAVAGLRIGAVMCRGMTLRTVSSHGLSGMTISALPYSVGSTVMGYHHVTGDTLNPSSVQINGMAISTVSRNCWVGSVNGTLMTFQAISAASLSSMTG